MSSPLASRVHRDHGERQTQVWIPRLIICRQHQRSLGIGNHHTQGPLTSTDPNYRRPHAPDWYRAELLAFHWLVKYSPRSRILHRWQLVSQSLRTRPSLMRTSRNLEPTETWSSQPPAAVPTTMNNPRNVTPLLAEAIHPEEHHHGDGMRHLDQHQPPPAPVQAPLECLHPSSNLQSHHQQLPTTLSTMHGLNPPQRLLLILAAPSVVPKRNKMTQPNPLQVARETLSQFALTTVEPIPRPVPPAAIIQCHLTSSGGSTHQLAVPVVASDLRLSDHTITAYAATTFFSVDSPRVIKHMSCFT